MNLSEIAPTKTNLLDFKNQLSFSRNGHKLLEQKREVLVMHLIEILSKIREQRERLNELIKKSHELYNLLEVQIGEFEMIRITNGIPESFEIQIQERSIMGVNIPSIHAVRSKKEIAEPIVSLSSTTAVFDQLFQNLQEVMKLIIIVAQVEISAWRLAHEIKKTQRRVNALENVFIPQFEEIVKYIQDTLEERERETFFQMKRVKNAKLEEANLSAGKNAEESA